MANANLTKAKKAKNDEFYTQYADIEKEMNAYIEYNHDVFRGKVILSPCDDPEWSNFTKYFAQNFEALGIKQFISTSYGTINEPRGKIFTLDHDVNGNGRIDIEDLEWRYLEGNGSYDSPEVTKIRDECDIIVTNPPFSLFRDFLNWIVEADKQFIILGNMNAITYKEVFPLIKDDKVWLGPSISSGDREFRVPKTALDMNKFTGEIRENKYYQKVMGVRWFTNVDHGRRHEPLSLMTMADNIRFSKHKQIKDKSYPKYDNYDAIEVCFTDAIPSDYEGAMGVPISFLDKYCPEQFEIIKFRKGNDEKDLSVNGKCPYFRVLIKHKGDNNANNTED